MTVIQAPVPLMFRLWPVAQHRHKFAVLIEDAQFPEFPHDVEQVVVAVCECGMRLTAAEIERVLDEREM
jgi:hypothetical protein